MNLKARRKTYRRLRRLQGFVNWLVKTHRQECFFCKCQITPSEFIQDNDHITLHHPNEDRDNPEATLVICHRGCHISYHKKLNRLKEEAANAKSS